MTTTPESEPRDDASTDGENTSSSLDRRSFLHVSAALAVAGGLSVPASSAVAQERGRDGGGRRRRQEEPQPPPPNSLPPSLQFQAAPEGTGVYLEALPSPAGEPERGIELEPWEGDLPSIEEDFVALPVHRLAVLLRDEEISPVELTEMYLDRLRRLDEKLLCVVNFMEETALEEAKQAEKEIASGNWRGPLHGIPWGVKDLFATRGVPTTWGAKPFENRIIDEDATVVERLRAAGAVLIAKLSTGTFAMGDQWFRGRTRNPWNLEQGSSGSSAGPASATAASCVGFAIGTETLGSIVSPARRCGISALRPTFGRVSRAGGMTLSWSMDKVGPMARTVEDCALVFDAIHGADPRDPSTLSARFQFDRSVDLSRMRIGYTEGTNEEFLEVLRELGAEPQVVKSRPGTRGTGSILSTESAAAFDDFVATDLDKEMVNDQRDRFKRGREVTALDYIQANRRRLAVMREMQGFFSDLDLYVSPRGDLGLTNLTGHPTVVVQSGFEDGQPNTITLVGNLFADDKLLSVAHAYQTATDWHTRRPEIA